MKPYSQVWARGFPAPVKAAATPAEAPTGTLVFIFFRISTKIPKGPVHEATGEITCSHIPTWVKGLRISLRSGWPPARAPGGARTSPPLTAQPPICPPGRTEPAVLLRVSVLRFLANPGLAPLPVWSLL